ncbi:regulatory protein GemA [Morganella morganii]|uniref:Regulatory protein GemA n=1 Tax=Morganella morganii TaxID=582 RepID=A0A8I0PU88_MORMO|nr:regulatory protein GemA [Morganella morganii]MBE8611490.1 regulatory protein GemA [Morganella morganii]
MERNKLIQLIHVGKSKLNMDTDTYRQLLVNLTGIASTGTMNAHQLSKVLAAMKGKGFRVKPAGKAKTRRPLVDYPQATKLRALWLEMHTQGFVRDSSEGALRRWVKRETKVDHLEWLTTAQASLAIEKLKNWQIRALKKQREVT